MEFLSFLATASLAATVVGVVGVVGAVFIRQMRFTPEERAVRGQAWAQMEVMGALEHALKQSESYDDIDLVALAQAAVGETQQAEKPDMPSGLLERLEAIEERMPEQSTVDKISSANEAILATKVEALEKEVERLRSDALTPWGVAKILILVQGSLLGLVAGVLALIRFA